MKLIVLTSLVLLQSVISFTFNNYVSSSQKHSHGYASKTSCTWTSSSSCTSRCTSSCASSCFSSCLVSPPQSPAPSSAPSPSTSSTSLSSTSTLQSNPESSSSQVSPSNPLRVTIAGAGVGGLALANCLKSNPKIDCRVVEKTSKFRRFGGPIQLASNALQVLKEMDSSVYDQVQSKFTNTGDKENGIKDGIRDEWYAKFDLATPAEDRSMPYTGVIDRPDLQEIFLKSLPEGMVTNGAGVETYSSVSGGGLKVSLDDGSSHECDVLIGADGIWSAVRASMRDEPLKGEGSGVSYSGYTVFAGELKYASPDNGQVGYKVYIGPKQYFVITDIGNGNYQWYAFLARPPGSGETEEMPEGKMPYLKDIFQGWSKDVHAILDVTKEDEIEQRDLYDRPPSVVKPWTDGKAALIGDAVHAMMPNLGQGGCQAIEDAWVLKEEIQNINDRAEIGGALNRYRDRRLIRSAAVQGLSRFASDIIIKGFDTPFKYNNGKLENLNYAGVVTKMMQPILPIFFNIQFNFLYEGYRNDYAVDLKAGAGLLTVGSLLLLLGAGGIGEGGVLAGMGLEGLLGGEGFEAILANLQDFF
ncbi:hypothetical protein TrRE_jg5379 [Triparma retinervis]|uniref:FAD-binding domain-containing protein n=1 Tax=Triparma retinervis TaxID=2557542 RepID=A0A9W6ZHB0_9STRA|nr:hypothetical protein TrRE_jg5379 [Triparma retinervis]